MTNCIIQSKTIWVTAQGEELDIQEMEDEHIRNCIYLVKRKVNLAEEIYELYKSNQIKQDIDNWTGTLKVFINELERRDQTGQHIERRIGTLIDGPVEIFEDMQFHD